MGKVLVMIDGQRATITINNPSKRNALDNEILQQIIQALDECNTNRDLRVVVIRGDGDKAFSSGYSIDQIDTRGDGQSLLEVTFARMRNFRLPIIGMLNGIVAGAGLDLSLNCDLRIAADDIKLGITPAKLGIIYHHDGIRRLAALVGIASAKELLLTGRLITAPQALSIGLINSMVRRESLESAVDDLAAELSRNAPLTLSGTKKVLNSLMNQSPFSKEQQEEFLALRLMALHSQDFAEGQKAFMEKREPVFQGK